ncbi:MAG: chemotaxis response regulator protein-glutamate methylesterase [Gammaproteobacteria bacterium]|nr:chemotaxis response regulator protein-glutamate methylesterase [Gammaproteobacteria bacterium]
MAARVLVVDDSGFFRRRIVEILNSDPRIEVIATAVDGKDAIRKVAEFKPDIVTMDVEMPVMDGITAVRRIMASNPTPILMLSSLTYDGAKSTLDALEAGAVDFLPKRFDEISQDQESAKRVLRARVRQLGARGLTAKVPVSSRSSASTAQVTAKPVQYKKSNKLVVIGSSTGGPVALQKVLVGLPQDFPTPILLVQHMPGSFTGPFAERLNQQCKITVCEAVDGDVLKAGTAYLAPGGRQMSLVQEGGLVKIKIYDADASMHYRPCVDLTFESVASIHPGKVLALVLTGMGADGREGARKLKQGGSTVWTQNEASCVIYGMPMAIVEAGLSDHEIALDNISTELVKGV